jgi:transcriptional regulator with XRE-family HTH domain
VEASWFPGRLRELRERAGLTQGQLADRAGVKRDAVARWEAGVREPLWSHVVALCQALGVGPDAFLHEPAARPAAGPGRPRKAAEEAPADGGHQPVKRPRARPRKEPAPAPVPKRPRGRPRKGG